MPTIVIGAVPLERAPIGDRLSRQKWSHLPALAASRRARSGHGSANGGCPYALNKYSMKVTATSGTDPTLSAISDMSIFANDVAWASTEFFLAKIEQKYAGRELVVDIWDAGDFAGDPNSGDTIEVIAGNGDSLSCS